MAVDRRAPRHLTLWAMTKRQHTGLDVLRRMARLVTVIVTMAYLLPGLLSVLPSPASAAEQQLYADLMMSRCLDGSNPAAACRARPSMTATNAASSMP